MKTVYVARTLIVVSLLFTGCVYESPLTMEHNIAIDPAILGAWVPDPDEGEEAQDEEMIILKYSDTEYLVHYPTDEDGMYYRAYPINIGGVPCVQLEILGAAVGPPKKDEMPPFHAASYQMTDGKLEISLLNTDLMSKDLKTTDELKKAFLEHRDDEDLFRDPGRFRRIAE